MLPLERLGLWRSLSEVDGCQLWAASRKFDRHLHGPTAATSVVLLNTGHVALHISHIEVLPWHTGAPIVWHRPGLVEPGESWILLDVRSLDTLIALMRQHGRRGFGTEGIVHRLVVHLDQPRAVQVEFKVSWGFSTPSYDMGFFLPSPGEEA